MKDLRKYDGGNVHFKDANGIPIEEAINFLRKVESSRSWEEVPAKRISINNGEVRDGSKVLGDLSPFAFHQLRRQVKARPHQIKDNDYLRAMENGQKDVAEKIHFVIVSRKLKELDKPIFLRIQKTKTKYVVLTALTSKYEHLKYSDLLVPFKGSMKVFRLHVDRTFLSIHLAEERTMFKQGDLKAGMRITSSDIGAAKLKMAFQLFRLVCTNGLMMPEEIFSFNRMHYNGLVQKWKEIVGEWVKKLPLVFKELTGFIKFAANREVTEENATSELLDYGLPRKRIERALEIARAEFQNLNRWSVANGISQASHEQRIGGQQLAISTSNIYDQIAVRFMSLVED